MDKFLCITLGELLEIKKLCNLSIKEALPEIRKMKDQHNFTQREMQNLIGLAKNFDTTLIMGE